MLDRSHRRSVPNFRDFVGGESVNMVVICLESPRTMNVLDAGKARSPLTFSMRHLLLAMLLLAIPLGLFRTYWTRVNDTVDERTIAFSDISFSVQIYLFASVMSLALIVAGVVVWLCIRRNYRTAMVILGLVIFIANLATPLVKSKILEPINGNPIAETHSNAASIAAMAIIKFFDRNERWPGTWSDLDEEITTVLEELNAGHEKSKSTSDPFASANDVDPYWGEEASQAISNRTTDLNGFTLSSLPKLVDVDFAANPTELASQKWYEFKGIIPKKPSYNVYRVEFKKLIGQLSKASSTNNFNNEKDK